MSNFPQRIKLKYGSWSQAAEAGIHLGELVYISDLDCLAVGDGRGGIKNVTQVIKGPDDGLYTKIDGIDGYVPLSIKV
jgi:hypothetical protein